MREPKITIDEIADFCQLTSCQVSLGASDAGFIQIAGTGVERCANYDRYLSFNEMSALPSPKAVLAEASVFKVHQGDTERTLDREQFQQELKAFRRRWGLRADRLTADN